MTAKRKSRKAKPATKKKKETRGRPTLFNEVIHTKIVELAEGGATDDEIASFIGVHVNTLGLWKRKHQDLMWALKEAKGLADELVEASLFRRACGYSHPAEKHFLQTDRHTGEVNVITHAYTEHFPPDTVAGIFWLKNRQPDRWREKPPDAAPPASENADIVIEWDDEDSS